MHMELGTRVRLSGLAKPGEATLVHIIEAGTVPSPEMAERFFGPKCPESVLVTPARVDRFVFLREESASYVIVPRTILGSATPL